MPRKVPTVADLKPFLKVRKPILDRTTSRLARSQSVGDLARFARRRVPKSVWEFVSGAAEDEITLDENRRALARVRFTPRAYGQVATPDISTTILGRPAPSPIIIAPTGFTRLSHHEGESAVARAAEDAGAPYCLSTMATTSISDVADAAPGGRNWFQVYLMRDRSITEAQLAEAKAAGYEALMLTIDTPATGLRRRDLRTGFDIPPRLTGRALLDMTVNPRWVYDLVTHEPLKFAALGEESPFQRWGQSGVVVEQEMRPEHIAWLRERWDGPVIVKGVMSAEDAIDSVDAGAAGVVVSNHGGRQLDRTEASITVLPRVRDAIGDRAEVYVDSGFRSGADIAAAIGLGADAVLIGRPYLYGLMMAGQDGVQKCLQILRAELRRTMMLLGTPTLRDIGPQHVSLAAPGAPEQADETGRSSRVGQAR
ncbi:alpha-hydroxy acid oxidase [Cumulibacter manganitolerans]|uniref:alpha-hydroxy acid oxidase n=1 Tax=Cumulibacter manganitolerans TaxID=1884992 RepID=UPI00129694DB|nr:alpha-hydroxy acid oxidase [Cumulibacter manganitolerans]